MNNQLFNLEKKVIVVTGASSGIGRQCSISCSKIGATLVIFGRNAEKINNTLSELEGNNHLFFIQDILDIEKFEAAINVAVKKLGPIDGFIHSAGLQNTLPLRLHTKDIFMNQFEVNAVAGFEACRILTKKDYFSSQGGSLVFISSIRGLYGALNQIGYSASKGAVISGARSLAIDLSSRNIRVNTVSPGMVEDTEMTYATIKRLPIEWAEKSKSEYPLGWVNTNDVANACVFLLSEGSKKITGTNIIVDGGFSAK